MELGRKHGVRTILNPAPATRLDAAVLRNVDYLTPNETELRILMGLSPDDPTPTLGLAQRCAVLCAGTLSRHAGREGRVVLAENMEVSVPGLAVEVVDTTGAGDAFNAGLAVALAEGEPCSKPSNSPTALALWRAPSWASSPPWPPAPPSKR